MTINKANEYVLLYSFPFNRQSYKKSADYPKFLHKKNEKMHAQKVKEEASRESDVEKARMILDEDEDLQ